jgi:hypothetical protein
MIILGIDGMDPVILKRLMDEGKLPHFRQLQNSMVSIKNRKSYGTLPRQGESDRQQPA